ncbi:MAG: type I secretion system permease/ATPase [Rhodocyclaceae bacterium]|nr:type I secretion system permease/ATPase [Rhodocyclaceae bacterium]
MEALAPEREDAEHAASEPAPGPAAVDVLLECLLAVVRSHGGALTREAALAGLPIDGDVLSPSLLVRAARRAGFSSRVLRQPLGRLNDALLPAIVLLDEDQACVVVGRNADTYTVVFPELGESTVELPRRDLAARYAGTTIYVRPEFRFDARAPQVAKIRGRHWFWGALAENAPLYRDVLLAAMMINAFAVALPLFTMNVYDRVVPNNAIDTLWMLAVGVSLVIAADALLRTMRGYFVDLAGSRVDVRLSAYIMERVLGLRLEHRPLSAGSFAANLRSFEVVRDFITSATITAFVDLPFALIFLLVIGWIAWPMTLPVIAGALIVGAYALVVRGRMHALTETTYRASALRNATLVESLVGLEAVKALGAEGVMQKRWEHSAAFLARVGAQLRLLSATTSNGAMWAQQTVNVALIVTGVYLIGENELTLGGLIACSMLGSRALQPVGQVTALLTQYHNASTALKSLDEILRQPVERPEGSNFVTRRGFDGDIEFRDLSFAYPGQETQALRNVSLQIRAGEHVAILGRVGSGKTTLQKLILGLYQPTEGALLIDGIDLRQLDPAELRRHVGYVSQDASMFYGSLRENLTIAARQASDDEVVEAARIGGILDFVNGHPQGFDMMVGERGESLSGGQRQGVALARAVIGRPSILLLDEPTGAMDHSTEEAVKRELAEFAHGRTLIIVTHRTSLLALASRVIVVDGGRIVADGPKERVIEALRQGRIGRAS